MSTAQPNDGVLASLLALPPVALPIGALIFLVSYLVSKSLATAVLDPLRDVPGPFIARFSDVWLLYQFWSNTWEKTNIAIHRKYGPIVRIAPGQYSLDDPESNKIIYSHSSHYVKSAFYKVWGHPLFTNLFNERDPAIHATSRRAQASAYAMSAVVSYEGYVDECSKIYRQRLDELVASSAPVDMHRYHQCYAFDVIGMLTYSHRLGFLDRCQDEAGLMSSIHSDNQWMSLTNVYPRLLFLVHFTYNIALGKFRGISMAMEHVSKHIDEQMRTLKPDSEPPTMDFVQKLIKVHKADPEKVALVDIQRAAGANTSAGSDTTGIGISSVVYSVYRDPRVLAKLREELDQAASSGALSDPITYQQAQKLPYLQACIKEAMRIHPAVGFTLPRVVPKGGATHAGRFIPQGSVVGVNPWVSHRNTELWGPDAAEYRPERWIDGKVPADVHFLAFGQGSRTCIGKNISLLEMSKLVPTIVRFYDITPQLPGDEWRCENRFFVKPMDFMCRVSKRQGV